MGRNAGGEKRRKKQRKRGGRSTVVLLAGRGPVAGAKLEDRNEGGGRAKFRRISQIAKNRVALEISWTREP